MTQYNVSAHEPKMKINSKYNILTASVPNMLEEAKNIFLRDGSHTQSQILFIGYNRRFIQVNGSKFHFDWIYYPS